MLPVRVHAAGLALALLLSTTPGWCGPYVTETSGVRWNDASGVRWNDASGVRWNDASGLRWNETGGVRWNDASGVFFTDASGVRWNDASGVRWNDASGLVFADALSSAGVSIDLTLLDRLSAIPDTSAISVVVTYRAFPTASDLADLTAIGIPGGTIFHRLPMVVVNATRNQIRLMQSLPRVRSIYSNSSISLFDTDSAGLIGAPELASDAELRSPAGDSLTGAGVTIATLDTGVDATHPDLPFGSKVIGNVRLNSGTGTGIGFTSPVPVEGVQNTDLVLGHGTFVASVAAGTGAASSGRYRGIAPGASILSLSAGDVVILNMLEGFDYLLEHASTYGVRIVNCSWGTEGWFDPDDPINVATRMLYDQGMTVVFAAGNHGPAPDTLNPYALAPWVIGVGSVRKDGTMSDFSSRGIYEELVSHPTLVAPGEGIIAAVPLHLSGVNGTVGVADPSGGVTVPPQDLPYYTVASGTSFAAPHVAGVVALMLEANPDLTPSRIKSILAGTATPMVRSDRSLAGAGRLDAWGAVAQTVDPSRAFGSFVPEGLDARAYTVTHDGCVMTTGYVPASSSTIVPLSIPPAASHLEISLGWGMLPDLNDLDIRLLSPSGEEIARSSAINGPSVFGAAEGLEVQGPLGQDMRLEVSFKHPGLQGQQFTLQQQTASLSPAGFGDLGSLSGAQTAIVALALSHQLVGGRAEGRFDPFSPITRGETARALAMAAGIPQRIPSSPSFSDVSPEDPVYPFVESAAGRRATRRIVAPASPDTFKPQSPIERLDFAVAMVRASGLAAEARTRSGALPRLADASQIPSRLRGFVAVALERGFLETLDSPHGRRFAPQGSLTRLEASGRFLRLVEPALTGSAPAGPSTVSLSE